MLSPQATPAEKAAYTRQLAERTRQRWNYLLTDLLMRTKVFNTVAQSAKSRAPLAAVSNVIIPAARLTPILIAVRVAIIFSFPY